MSRLRWILAGVLAVVAAIASVQSLLTYLEHHITVGVLSVLALAITLAVGLVSLAQARLRIEREWQGLRAQPPRGELYTQRLRRLEAIRSAGVRPDAETLAESSAAEEAGRAYIGRYLVATTVLIGLVGTFAGLMETLGKVSPLLSESGNGGLALLAAPLAGLHVTFGASLVAILATLALALAQGDLALHEELALATLRDVTAHDLVPRLFPVNEDGADRTVQAIVDLKQTFGDALVRSLEKSAGRLAAETRSESERAAKALETAAGAVEKQITRLCDTIATTLAEGSRKQTAAIIESAAKQTDAVTKNAAATSETLAKSTAGSAQALADLRAQLQQALVAATAQHAQTLTAATDAVAGRLGDAATTALAAMRTEWEGAIGRTSAIADQALRQTLATHEQTLLRVVTTSEAASLKATEAAETVGLKAAEAAEQATRRGAVLVEEAITRGIAASEAATERAVAAAEAAAARGAAAAEEASQRAVAAATEASLRGATAAEAAAERGATAAEEAAARGAAAAEDAVQRSITVCEEALRGMTERLGNSVEPLFATEAGRLEAVREALTEISARLDVAGGRLTEVTGAVAELGRGHTSALEETGKAVLSAFDRAVVGGGAALDGAATVLAQAAKDLRAGTEGFAPTISQLSADLQALGREVALMAARAPDNDGQVVVMAELERLGTGVDRLTSLYELAQAQGQAPAADLAAETAVAADAELGAQPEAASPDDGAEPGALPEVATSDATGEIQGDVTTEIAAGQAEALVEAPAEGLADQTDGEAPAALAVEADPDPAIAVDTAGERTADEGPIATAEATTAVRRSSNKGKRKSRTRGRATDTSTEPPAVATEPDENAGAAEAGATIAEPPSVLLVAGEDATEVAADGTEADPVELAATETDAIELAAGATDAGATDAAETNATATDTGETDVLELPAELEAELELQADDVDLTDERGPRETDADPDDNDEVSPGASPMVELSDDETPPPFSAAPDADPDTMLAAPADAEAEATSSDAGAADGEGVDDQEERRS